MVTSKYNFNEDHYLQKVNALNWKTIDLTLPEIPTGYYNFEPNEDEKIHYQRLLYLLTIQDATEFAYHLSTHLICLNPNNYYALILRQGYVTKTLPTLTTEEINHFAAEELHFTNCWVWESPKEYQAWNYKKDLIKEFFSIDSFKDLVKKDEEFLFELMVNGDNERNYHVWDYKLWLTKLIGNFEEKIKETNNTIFMEGSQGEEYSYESLWKNCYSCWSFRFNLILQLPADKIKTYIIEDNERVLKFVFKNPQNECAWNFLTGLIESKYLPSENKTETVNEIYKVTSSVKEQNRYAWMFLLQVGEKHMKEQALLKLKQIDPIRELYYRYLEEIQYI